MHAKGNQYRGRVGGSAGAPRSEKMRGPGLFCGGTPKKNCVKVVYFGSKRRRSEHAQIFTGETAGSKSNARGMNRRLSHVCSTRNLRP